MLHLRTHPAGASLVLLIALTCSLSVAAENIYPDPSFEQSGIPGVARTGERAGYLRVGARDHWSYIGQRIEVEPFARYRVTEWVKGTINGEGFFAPYCYEWNSYVWSFAVSRTPRTSEDWVQMELTFISPHETMYVHPLAYIEAANCEAWVDDIVVEKIGEPAQVMAELEAKQNRSGSDNEILARWLLREGRREDAAGLMRSTQGVTRADIACIIAADIEDPAARRPFIVEMVAAGGMTYNDGMKRFGEITQGLSTQDKIAVCEDAVEANPGSELPARSLQIMLTGAGGTTSSLATVAEAEVSLSELRASLERLIGVVPGGSKAQEELKTAMGTVDRERQELSQRRASLGECTVTIGGRALSPDTHAIVIPDEPTLQEEHAAKDLRYHLELITGKVLPMVNEARAGNAIALSVGKTGAAADIDFPGLGIEGIHIRTEGPALILAGNKRGVLYATYTFLEDYLGCRWFAPDCSKWPTEGTLAVPQVDRRYIPPLEYRATDYPSSRPADFSVRNKYNGASHQPDEARGGKISYRGFVHTFNALVPPEKYFAEHPEYYSEIGGKRVGPDHSQLCLTNPEVLAIAIDTVKRWIRESPDATIISVSQNDWHNYCQCDECTALAEHEGSQSGPLLHFVNAIADAVKDEYPHIIIDTLAYQYTRKPPLHVRPRPNVAVRLCSIECCFIHPLETDEYNKTFVDDIEGWNAICDRLHIWDYVINYAHSICPFPNFYVLGPNIDFFIRNGVTGIYEEACYYTPGSELQELRTYVMAKLLWDPSYDTDKAIDEFCRGYWGPAGTYIRQFINTVHESAQSIPDMHVRIYSPPSVGYLTDEVLSKSDALFDQAEAAVADDPVLLHRVEVARLPVLYTRIALATSGAYTRDGDALVQSEGTDVSALAEQFERIARAAGVTKVREGGPLASLDAWLASLPRGQKKLGIRTIDNPALQVSVIPEAGGRLWSIKHLPSGRELLRVAGQPGSYEPTEGGYEEYSESGYRSPGFSEAYEVVAADERSITLEANLRNNLKLTRSLSLDLHGAVLNVESTLTNVGNATTAACLRVHPEFAVCSTQSAHVRVRRPDGTWQTTDLASPQDPKAEKEVWLRGEDLPAGRWAAVDLQTDLAIVNHVARDDLESCLLNWNGEKSRVNLELFSKQKKLAPGETLTLRHSYEVAYPASGR